MSIPLLEITIEAYNALVKEYAIDLISLDPSMKNPEDNQVLTNKIEQLRMLRKSAIEQIEILKK